MIARWSDEDPLVSTADARWRRARRVVAEALLKRPLTPRPAAPPVSAATAWGVTVWLAVVLGAYAAQLVAEWR